MEENAVTSITNSVLGAIRKVKVKKKIIIMVSPEIVGGWVKTKLPKNQTSVFIRNCIHIIKQKGRITKNT